MAISGIYKITCRPTGKFYIGSSVDIETRWRGHKSRLSRNIHANIYLQRAWNKYGENNFKFETIEITKSDLLKENELKWFKITNCCNNKFGFNIHKDPVNPIQDNQQNNFKRYVHKERKNKISKIKIPKIPKIRKMSEKIISFENISIASKEHFRHHAKGNVHILEDKEIIHLYVYENRSCGDISLLDGRCESTIYKILLENNIKLRDRSKANKIVSDEILIKLYNLGLSLSQVGILVGVNPTTISKRFTLIDFPTRIPCQAKGVRYTKEEFKRFFMNDKFKELIRERD